MCSPVNADAAAQTRPRCRKFYLEVFGEKRFCCAAVLHVLALNLGALGAPEGRVRACVLSGGRPAGRWASWAFPMIQWHLLNWPISFWNSGRANGGDRG